MKQIFLTPEMAKRWYNGTDAELKELALQTYPDLFEKQLPKSWGELEKVSGYYLVSYGAVRDVTDAPTEENNISIFATKEQAEASIALAQLSQLMKVYNGDWVANWSDSDFKYCLEFYVDELIQEEYTLVQKFLAFKDAKTRDLFLDNFRELILKAKPLL